MTVSATVTEPNEPRPAAVRVAALTPPVTVRAVADSGAEDDRPATVAVPPLDSEALVSAPVRFNATPCVNPDTVSVPSDPDNAVRELAVTPPDDVSDVTFTAVASTGPVEFTPPVSTTAPANTTPVTVAVEAEKYGDVRPPAAVIEP